MEKKLRVVMIILFIVLVVIAGTNVVSTKKSTDLVYAPVGGGINIDDSGPGPMMPDIGNGHGDILNPENVDQNYVPSDKAVIVMDKSGHAMVSDPNVEPIPIVPATDLGTNNGPMQPY